MLFLLGDQGNRIPVPFSILCFLCNFITFLPLALQAQSFFHSDPNPDHLTVLVQEVIV